MPRPEASRTDKGVLVTLNETQTREDELLASVPDGLFIGGQWRAASGDKTLVLWDLATGQSIDDVESWPVRIDAVTADQVNAAARAVLSQTNHVTGLLLPPTGKDS